MSALCTEALTVAAGARVLVRELQLSVEHGERADELDLVLTETGG